MLSTIYQDNTDEISAAQNFYVKSSHGDKIIILNRKRQKNKSHYHILENNSCGGKVVVLNLDNADKICAAQNVYTKSLQREDNYLWATNAEKYMPLKYSRKQFFRGHSSCT